MIVEYHRKGRSLVIWGFSLFVGSFLLAIVVPNFVKAYIQANHGSQPTWIRVLEQITPGRMGNIGLVAVLLLIIGVVFLAKGKGYHIILGLFLGFLLLIGLLIVLVLPDREKD